MSDATVQPGGDSIRHARLDPALDLQVVMNELTSVSLRRILRAARARNLQCCAGRSELPGRGKRLATRAELGRAGLARPWLSCRQGSVKPVASIPLRIYSSRLAPDALNVSLGEGSFPSCRAPKHSTRLSGGTGHRCDSPSHRVGRGSRIACMRNVGVNSRSKRGVKFYPPVGAIPAKLERHPISVQANPI